MNESEIKNRIESLEREIKNLKNNPVGVLTDPQSKDNISLIIEDRIHRIMWDKVFYHSSVFESVDRYTNTGSFNVDFTGAVLSTISGSVAAALLIEPGTVLFADKETYFSIVVSVNDVSECVFSAGILSGLSGGYVAMNIDAGTIKGLSNDGTTTKSIDIGTATDGEIVLLECVYYPGTRVEFFVNGTLKGTITANLNPITTPINKIISIGMDPKTGGSTTAIATLTHYKILQKQE